MLITSQTVPYFIAVFISVSSTELPEQGWVQMMRPFETRKECLVELETNERMYFHSVINNLKHIIRRVHDIKCMTEENIDGINKEFGHPQSDDDNNNIKKENIGV